MCPSRETDERRREKEEKAARSWSQENSNGKTRVEVAKETIWDVHKQKPLPVVSVPVGGLTCCAFRRWIVVYGCQSSSKDDDFTERFKSRDGTPLWKDKCGSKESS